MGSFVNIALSAEVLVRAIKIALVVGTLLAAINHADALLDGSFALKNLIQVVLSYLVSYAVSTYSSVGAIQQRQRAAATNPTAERVRTPLVDCGASLRPGRSGFKQ